MTTSLLDVRYRTNPKGILGQLVLGKDLCKVFGLVNTGPVSPSTDLLMMYRVCSVQIEHVQLPAMVGMIGPNRLGSVPRVLEVLNANSNRTELDERAVQQFFRPVQS